MDEQLVTVRTCLYLHEAEIVKSVLEAEGIDVEIPDELMAGVQPALGGGIGGIRVQIRESDLDRANEALAAVVPAG